MTCNACNRTIHDRLMSKTSPDNKFWHSECLKCCECNKLLDSKYFETSGRLYCLHDYLTYFRPSCFGCAGDPMHGNQATQSNTLFFHDKCFACNYCSRPLIKGDKYCILDNSTTPQKTLMICHDICALKYHSANNINNNNVQSSNDPLVAGGQALQTNVPAPRAKRGRMKQNRPA